MARALAWGGVGVLVVASGAVMWWAMRLPPVKEADPPAELAAAQDPAAATSAPAPAVAPEVAPEAPLAPEPPGFDVVRVDAAGLATVAGTAPPGAMVELVLDGVALAKVAADGAGQFATIVSLPPSEQPRLLGLRALLSDGQATEGRETVAIGPVQALAVASQAPAVEPADTAVAEAADTVVAEQAESELTEQPAKPELATEAPVLAPPPALLLTDAGVTVLQGAEPAPLAVSIDSISYGAQGQVQLAGRAAPGATVRLYLDDAPVAEAVGRADGLWRAEVTGVDAGLHALRADQIDAEGKVTARFETPFQRDLPAPGLAPAAPEATASENAPEVAAAPITITVQPGLTLWAIARENFGEGVMYVQVFEANRDKIKDPDLIYPGQVFTVPKP